MRAHANTLEFTCTHARTTARARAGVGAGSVAVRWDVAALAAAVGGALGVDGDGPGADAAILPGGRADARLSAGSSEPIQAACGAALGAILVHSCSVCSPGFGGSVAIAVMVSVGARVKFTGVVVRVGF